VLIYLVAAAIVMTRCSQPRRCRAMLRRRTKVLGHPDPHRCGRLGEPDCHLRRARGHRADRSALRIYVTLAIGTVVLSWTFIHTIFALHYATSSNGTVSTRTACAFPATLRGLLGLHLFFFVVGMTFRCRMSRSCTRWRAGTVVAHGALSFFFTTAVVAMAVILRPASFRNR